MDAAERLLHESLPDLQRAVREQLWAYVQGLLRWNQAYNLTAIRDPEQMVRRHILDSASIAPYVHGRLLDVGTGAGFPGLVLAIMHPQMPVTLLDSNGKKTRFLRQMVAELGLPQVKVVQARAEDEDGELYDSISSRAYASLPDMVLSCLHRLAVGGRLLAMKGKYPQEELQQLDAQLHAEVVRLHLQHVDEERHLIIIRRTCDEG